MNFAFFVFVSFSCVFEMSRCKTHRYDRNANESMVDKSGIGPANTSSNASSSAKRLYLAQFLESPVSISAAPASIGISSTSVYSIHIPESDGITTKRPSSVKTFSVSMKIGLYKYDQEMANPRSERFQKTAYEIESALRNIFLKQLSNFVAVRVFKLEQGSVIVSYNVHVASSSKQKSSDVQNIITTNAENGELQHLKVSGVVVTQLEDDKSSDNGSTSTFIYILCGVGGLLAIGIIVLAVSKYRDCSKRNQVRTIRSNAMADTNM